MRVSPVAAIFYRAAGFAIRATAGVLLGATTYCTLTGPCTGLSSIGSAGAIVCRASALVVGSLTAAGVAAALVSGAVAAAGVATAATVVGSVCARISGRIVCRHALCRA